MTTLQLGRTRHKGQANAKISGYGIDRNGRRAMRLLDAYCGQGGAAGGYARAGFEVVGVDLADHSAVYPFEFHQGDAVQFILDHGHEFDVIHASPPCQAHSTITNAVARKQHLDLIPATREALHQVNKPFIIENVEGARKVLVDPVRLCGSAFGLKVRRHRYFETSFTVPELACRHREQGPVVGVYGNIERGDYSRRPDGTYRGRKANSPEQASAALGGTEWMTWRGMTQCIPPAYTEYIGAVYAANARGPVSFRATAS